MAAAILGSLLAVLALAATASAETVTESATYSATTTIPVPPASNFAGSGGGDGWAVALSETAVYNVFHHSQSLQLACHLQSDAEPCFSPETITDGEGHDFSASGQPGLYLDQHTGKLYVYATRMSDATAGVVCVDTTLAPTNPDPFCGFTALTPAGEAPLTPAEISGASAPMLVGDHWYAFNFVNGVNRSGAENELLCFDVSTDEPCSSQPYAVSLGEGEVSDFGFPSPATAAIGSRIIVPLNIAGVNRLACFDPSTGNSCAGSWPVTIKAEGYAAQNGAPFPFLDAGGTVIGLCIPTGTDECFNLEGEEIATPAGMSSIVGASSPWNGAAFVLGPRVYLPDGNAEGGGQVECFDYSTGAGCAGYPKTFEGLSYLYTVNADPQRPTCIWVNADNGEHEIQNFDAYTREACGAGTIRALASQMVVPQPECTPASYISLQVVQPARPAYATGSIAFDDGDGNPIPGLEERTLDETGSANLAGLGLNTPTGLPQFLFTFTGVSGSVGSVEVKLTWTANYDIHCVGASTSVVRHPAPEPTPTSTATPPAPPSTATTQATPAVVCSGARLQLVNIAVHGSTVSLAGEARRSLVGHSVSIRFLGTGGLVATAVVQPDGTFSATAPLPPPKLRRTNLARYQAFTGSITSLPLKLYRRMYMTGVHVANGRVLMTGKVTGKFKPSVAVPIMVRIQCSTEKMITKTKLRKDGTFSVSFPIPTGATRETAMYRATTTVLLDQRHELTYTLPTPPDA